MTVKWDPKDSFSCWVKTQRYFFTHGCLHLYRKKKLDRIGFVWRLKMGERPEQWKKFYNELKQFKVRLHASLNWYDKHSQKEFYSRKHMDICLFQYALIHAKRPIRQRKGRPRREGLRRKALLLQRN